MAWILTRLFRQRRNSRAVTAQHGLAPFSPDARRAPAWAATPARLSWQGNRAGKPLATGTSGASARQLCELAQQSGRFFRDRDVQREAVGTNGDGEADERAARLLPLGQPDQGFQRGQVIAQA
jgi:hypothetical protein